MSSDDQVSEEVGVASSIKMSEEKSIPEPPTEPSFPEGGFKAWATVLGSCLLQMCGFGYVTSFGVFQDYYVRVYLKNVSPSAISWIGSVNVLVVIAGGLLAGRIYDRGHFYFLLYTGAILSSFSLFMLSLAKEGQFYQVFLCQGLALGLGGGMVYVPSIAIISHYFQRRRNLVMTIVSSASALGAVVHPIMLNNTLYKIGFAKATRASAGFISGMLLLACILMRTRLPPPKTLPNLTASLKKFSKDKAYVTCGVGLFFFTIGMYFPLFYLQLDANLHGINSTFSFYSLVILNASSFVGRATSGFLLPLGIGRVIIATTTCCTILIFSMAGISNEASVVVIAIIYGYSVGVFIAMASPLLASLADSVSEIGIRLGIGFTLSGVGGFIGTPIDGALLTSNFHWLKAVIFSGVMALMGCSCMVLTLFFINQKKRSKSDGHTEGNSA